MSEDRAGSSSSFFFFPSLDDVIRRGTFCFVSGCVLMVGVQGSEWVTRGDCSEGEPFRWRKGESRRGRRASE